MSSDIVLLKLQIEEIKEYLENYLCKQCADMQQKLRELEDRLQQISN